MPPPVSRPWLGAAVIAWLLASLVVVMTSPIPISPGPVATQVTLVSDPLVGRYGSWVIAEGPMGSLLLELDDSADLRRGDTAMIEGHGDGTAGRRTAHTYRSRVRIDSIEVVTRSTAPHLRLGDAVRERVVERLKPFDSSRGLLAGFLIGDTVEIDPADLEAMRHAGLTHFVAVSGSNVALFLGLLAFVAGPLALGPKRRAVVGLLGLPVYAAATRFEPSVLRASVMAALALGGRLVGIVFEAWQLLSLAVIVLLALEPSLTTSAGFQLSVAATAGVLVGARWPVGGGWARRSLAVTVGAQLAVAPLMLLHFGSVPLMSPLLNLLAAPLVTASTLLGALGVAGPGLLLDVATWLAGVVLGLARVSVDWPQIGPWLLVTLVASISAAIRWQRLRVPVTLGLTAALLLLVLGWDTRPPDPGVVVLDVGQGDAILIHGGDGRFALVDGGPDGVVLMESLRSYGVTTLDLVVLSHVHADHATGLVTLAESMPVGEFWASTAPHETEASLLLMAELQSRGIPVNAPRPGDVRRLGGLQIRVEGPLRRYASPNDQSIVLTVAGPARSMLLAGDIETFAQADLEHLTADVLKVPHQGAATSDRGWLASVGADLAVISVGPNQFGHPAPWVIDVLEESGAEVERTDMAGDVVVDLG